MIEVTQLLLSYILAIFVFKSNVYDKYCMRRQPALKRHHSDQQRRRWRGADGAFVREIFYFSWRGVRDEIWYGRISMYIKVFQ
jgi:hypothetical protein